MDKENGSLAEVIKVFFRLGLTAFGGPAAHIAMMEKELVEEKKWIDHQHFLDLIGATNLIPGPNSTEMTMHCGRERAGIPGLFAAGAAFIFPSALLTGILAWAYVTYGELPQVIPFMAGIAPVVLAIMSRAIWKLGKKATGRRWQKYLLVIVLAAALQGANEILLLIGTGLLAFIIAWIAHHRKQGPEKAGAILLLGLTSPGSLSGMAIFWKFLKVGSILYGSGYVLFAYLVPELVETGHMTRTALLDAIAMGQFTPGPVLTTATFIGYNLGGWTGAVAATLGIFLPSFLFVLLLNPLIPKMRSWPPLSTFLDAVNVAAVAVMTAVLIEMGLEALQEWQSICVALLGGLMTFGRPQWHSMWTVFAGALLSFILFSFF